MSRVWNKSQVSGEKEEEEESRNLEVSKNFHLVVSNSQSISYKLLLYLYRNDGGKFTAPCSLLSPSLIPSIPSRRMIDSLSFTNATLYTH